MIRLLALVPVAILPLLAIRAAGVRPHWRRLTPGAAAALLLLAIVASRTAFAKGDTPPPGPYPTEQTPAIRLIRGVDRILRLLDATVQKHP
ncbi:MAG: hypothetical protein IJ783_07390 [Kiritimatiellae bacterium]|nr:hypothetical protein [Kiritimatiellia bacterium]